MSDEIDLRVLGFASISQRCAQETELFFQRQRYDPRYCYELFRRAIVDRSQEAWERIYAQYRPLVAGWVGRHPAFPASGEEAQYFVNRAFEKMWGALGSDKFGRFPDLKSLLRYLQMCVHSVVVDQARAAEQALVDVPVDAAAAHSGPNALREADWGLVRVYRQEFWDEIRARLNDEKEQLVMFGSFALGLKPRELYAQTKEVFRDVKEIYRVKENVLARLRRDAELAQILSPDA